MHPRWSFVDSFPAERSDALLKTASFESILKHLSSAEVKGFAWRPYREAKLRGCNRAEFRLVVDPKTYDAFFNAPIGLRGQYANCEEQGEAATRRAISILEPKLLAFQRGAVGPSDDEIQWSLAAPQAKIWIDEDEEPVQHGGTEPEILYPPWQQNSETGVGLLAPQGTRIIVMGGWIDATNVVRNNPDKNGRSSEIRTTGFS